MSHLTLRRAAVGVAGISLTLVASVGLAPTASASPAGSGSHWLAGQLRHGLVHNGQYKFDDYGLTADTGLALAALGGHDAKLAAIGDALADHVASWTTGADSGTSDVYAGSTAKAIVLAQAVGTSPHRFGRVDLVKQLERRVTTSGPATGRISDKSAFGDFANTVGQALAAQGLTRAGSSRAHDTVRFLLQQQCSAGYFRLSFAPADQRQQSCDAGDADSSAPDVDATALAVLSLESIKQDRTTSRAVGHAVRWLEHTQARNGSFGGGTTTSGANTNSTGLAARALGEARACRAAQSAATWVHRLQVRGPQHSALKGEQGAIAYDRTAYAAGTKNGIGQAERDQWRRATAQAAPGLRYLHTSGCS